jgi:hypothetical protein
VDELGHAVQAGTVPEFVRLLRSHLDGVLAWTTTRISNGAVEELHNRIKSFSHCSFEFRCAQNFIAAVYRCCARLPLPAERKLHSLGSAAGNRRLPSSPAEPRQFSSP